MPWFLDDFEFTILKRVFLVFTILFACTFLYAIIVQFSVGLSYEKPQIILALRITGCLVNLVGILLYSLNKTSKAWLLPTGLVLILINFTIIRIAQIFIDSSKGIASVTFLISLLFVIITGLFVRRIWVTLTLSSCVLIFYILVFIIFPNHFFLGATISSNNESLLVLTSGTLLILFLLVILLDQSIGNLLYNHLKANQEHLKTLAYFDQDTGLPNGRRLETSLGSALAQMKKGQELAILAGIRLDGISELNEKQGYEETNQWLIQFAQDLALNLSQWGESRLSRAGAKALQLYRAETGIFLFPLFFSEEDLPLKKYSPEEFQILILKVLNLSQQGKRLDFTGAFSVYPEDAQNSADLLRNVLNILHRNTASDRSSFVPFNASTYLVFLRRERIIEELSLPAFTTEIRTVYQPKVSVNGEHCTGFEALARWQNKLLGHISPSEFIPLSEHSTAIEKITEIILRDIDQFITTLRYQGADHFHVSFNLSPILLTQKYLDNLISWIEKTNNGPFMEIEITEGVLLRHTVIVENAFNQLKGLGVFFSIDDFGTGYSNLSYLQSFKAEVLKIDKCFIDGLPLNEKNANLVRTIIHLARSFGMSSIAEGVEYTEQVDFLKREGCEQIQGFFYSRPLETLDAISFYLSKNKPEGLL